MTDITDSITPDELRAVVSDDGDGFEPKARRHERDPEHIGLSSMHERARLLNGSLYVSSKPGGGTSVRLRLPLADADDRAA